MESRTSLLLQLTDTEGAKLNQTRQPRRTIIMSSQDIILGVGLACPLTKFPAEVVDEVSEGGRDERAGERPRVAQHVRVGAAGRAVRSRRSLVVLLQRRRPTYEPTPQPTGKTRHRLFSTFRIVLSISPSRGVTTTPL